MKIINETKVKNEISKIEKVVNGKLSTAFEKGVEFAENELQEIVLEFAKWKDLNFFESERHLNRPVIYVAYKQEESKEYSLEQLFDKFILERNK